ncbi:unnamed protein product [Linum trigynum]|uniref:Uncharacterized protein n=1 Tax=Linum trigynum TaxID=586398 RepID=A0AAV2GDB1_9ROSI
MHDPIPKVVNERGQLNKPNVVGNKGVSFRTAAIPTDKVSNQGELKGMGELPSKLSGMGRPPDDHAKQHTLLAHPPIDKHLGEFEVNNMDGINPSGAQ